MQQKKISINIKKDLNNERLCKYLFKAGKVLKHNHFILLFSCKDLYALQQLTLLLLSKLKFSPKLKVRQWNMTPTNN